MIFFHIFDILYIIKEKRGGFMKFTIGKGGKSRIILVKKDEEINNDLYSYLVEHGLFKGKLSEVYFDLSTKDDSTLFLGLGEEKTLNYNSLRKAFYKAGKELTKFKIESVELSIPEFKDLDYEKSITAITEGFLQSQYAFEKYLTVKKLKPSLKEVYFHVEGIEEDLANKAISEAEVLIDAINLTRDLVNERAINLYPETLAQAAKENLEDLGIKVDIFGKDKIKDLKMEAFLAVTEGSDKEPKFIVMEYKGDPTSDKKIAFVGKGLTYDSGGYSLKPSTSMDTMFTDMAGSATVIGAMKAIAKSNLKANVVGIIAACENLVSGRAYKPGDIIGSMAGKTIEVLNTDAEGRLTLADALWYAATVVKADKIVDLATLTGACVVALGNTTTGAISNNDDLMKDVLTASELSGEPIWQLPSFDDYKEFIKSEFADIKNIGDKGAGTITAGLFLEVFVNDTPWVHLDIAGTAYDTKPSGYLPKGASGVHVKTLYYLIKDQ